MRVNEHQCALPIITALIDGAPATGSVLKSCGAPHIQARRPRHRPYRVGDEDCTSVPTGCGPCVCPRSSAYNAIDGRIDPIYAALNAPPIFYGTPTHPRRAASVLTNISSLAWKMSLWRVKKVTGDIFHTTVTLFIAGDICHNK